jgi:hypothetical protein
MGLMDSLRRTEEQGKALARRGMEKARGAVEDTERAMRRRMRVHPQRTESAAAPYVRREEAEPTEPAPKPIVSIHGRDVDLEDLDKNAA